MTFSKRFWVIIIFSENQIFRISIYDFGIHKKLAQEFCKYFSIPTLRNHFERHTLIQTMIIIIIINFTSILYSDVGPLVIPLADFGRAKKLLFFNLPQTHTALVYLSRTLLQPPLFSTPLTHYAFTQDADVC